MEENATLTDVAGKGRTVKDVEATDSKKPIKTIISKLTAAENRVLALVSFAKTNKEIASTLGISPATVKRHLENILDKLQLRNRVEAAIYGLIIAGCSCGRKSDCPLEVWQQEKVRNENWAD